MGHLNIISIPSQVVSRGSPVLDCRALDILRSFIILQDGFHGICVWRRAAALTSCKGLTAAARASIGTEPISSANPKYTMGCLLNLVRSFNYYQKNSHHHYHHHYYHHHRSVIKTVNLFTHCKPTSYGTNETVRPDESPP